MVDYSEALKCAILSQEIYKTFSDKFQFGGFPSIKPQLIDKTETDTQLAILSDASRSTVYIVFRGSEKQMDWDTNFDFKQIEDQIVKERDQTYPYAAQSQSGARLHEGFSNAYMSVRDTIHEFMKTNPVSKVVLTGHSLGGALATIGAVDVQYNFDRDPRIKIEVFTFGAPRVGNGGFRDSFNRRVPDSYRFIYGMDIVPALPRPWQGYSHVDTEYRLGPRFSLNFLTQRFKDHSITSYISALKEKAA